ncbi:hypothetical protein HDU91_002216 [Kappamyces sp. JEL0680]|nr:hypothetical protein HDU91_002216 [Kappamyces sp. JEL0680]
MENRGDSVDSQPGNFFTYLKRASVVLQTRIVVHAEPSPMQSGTSSESSPVSDCSPLSVTGISSSGSESAKNTVTNDNTPTSAKTLTEADATLAVPKESIRNFSILKKLTKSESKAIQTLTCKKKGHSAILHCKLYAKAKVATERLVNEVLRERYILQQLRDDFFCCKLHYAFQDLHYLYLLTDYSEVTLQSVAMHGPMKDSALRVFASEIAFALNYLHQNFIIYRNLRLDTVLLKDGHVLLSDFSFACSTRAEKFEPLKRSDHLNPPAPEIYSKKEYRYSVDWWSFGAILYHCTYGLPFNANDHKMVLKSKASGNMMTNLSDREDLYSRLLEADVDRRLGSSNGGLGFARDIMVHPWFALVDWILVKNKEYTVKDLQVGAVGGRRSRSATVSNLVNGTIESLLSLGMHGEKSYSYSGHSQEIEQVSLLEGLFLPYSIECKANPTMTVPLHH